MHLIHLMPLLLLTANLLMLIPADVEDAYIEDTSESAGRS